MSQPENHSLSVADNDHVLAGVTTAAVQRGRYATLPGVTTVRRAVAAVLEQPPRNDADRGVQEQLRREIAGPHDFFTVTRTGALTKVDPETPLHKIAVPRELRTPDGLTEVRTVAIEVQQYAEVG